ncbi:hypothetical protein EWM64_g3408 [Hericium alpestre]|uniref:SMP-30/Gluconolactonase/LRE-like region domain-containing protein n=1 Tax=Hericium alpestre TaxID=135208 RepID=A0A4Z0A407_9AGAM|nr:hypothetical protein EWM64_g3408 [Hericium alpestre]
MTGRIGIASASLFATFVALAYAGSKSTANNGTNAIPAQAVLIDLPSLAVLGADGTFRQDEAALFNPTNTTPPFFQVSDQRFLALLGSNASIRAVASNVSFAFAHEAPIWVPETDELFFASNTNGLGDNVKIGMISLRDVDRAVTASNSTTSALNVSVIELNLPDTIQVANGGTGPFRGNLLFATSGMGSSPPSVALVNPHPPNNVTILLDNYFGRQFNSLNDIKVHPKNGKIFFTDTTYGFLSHFRPEPLMRNQVYRFDPDTRGVRVVADGYLRPNGIAFSGDGKIAYVTDTGLAGGFLGNNQTDPATIYQYDIDPVTDQFLNRRVFAFIDTGIPDGIQVDVQGNVYAGCGDGVHVWAPDSTLLGKFFLGTTSANMAFAGPGRLMINAENAIFMARIAAHGLDLASFT